MHAFYFRPWFTTLLAVTLGGCATVSLRSVDRPPSRALPDPAVTRLGRQFLGLSAEHGGRSGFYLIEAGVAGLAARIQMVRSAERTLDVQYFIFRGDETGTFLTEELRHAADRGVRVRVLVDDGDTKAGDEHLLQLDGHPNIEVRVFNPFGYRNHNFFLRNLDFLLHESQLDYRMHNKLLVVDNAVALAGGRNIGNQYFQVDPRSQFADADVFVAGPLVQTLSGSFDQFWNSDMVAPARALGATARPYSAPLTIPIVRGSGIDYVARADSGSPYDELLGGQLPLRWAPATVVYDSPDKKSVEAQKERGRLMSQAVEERIGNSDAQLLMVTPYFAPSAGELSLLRKVRSRGASVRVLTNSLESSPSLAAQSGYDNSRLPLAQAGVQFYEIRPQLGSTAGSGQARRISRYGNYALHAKLYVFDRRRLFVGSWNFDERSLHINTEIGLLIDDAALAGEVAERVDAMTRPEASFHVIVAGDGPNRPQLMWETRIDHRMVRYSREPSRGWWRRLGEDIFRLLPLRREL
jgi:putative cardiolipin synthase